MAVIYANAFVVGQAAALDEVPLSHARILYRNRALDFDAEVQATSEADGAPAAAAINPLTFEFWQPVDPAATWEVFWQEVKPLNACGIASHNLGTKGIQVSVDVFDGVDWLEQASFVPADDGPILVLWEEGNFSGARVRVAGDSPAIIAAIYFGRTLDMMRPIYAGHRPVTLSRTTTLTNPRSERGQGLGFRVKQEGATTAYSWSNLDPVWYREQFDPFVNYASRGSGYFFIAWRPGRFPNEVGYGAITGDIAPTNSGTHELMDVQFTLDGIGPLARS